jgi:hypothetical protein
VRRASDLRIVSAIIVGVAILGLSAWVQARRDHLSTAIRPTYDATTGRLTELSYDSNHDGRPDTWTDMDGTRPLRSRIDTNGDGRIDRWEEYDATGALVKVGFSTKDDGHADAWVTPEGQASIRRVEISSTGDEHRIDRWEYYDVSKPGSDGRGVLVRVEQDTVGDGKPHRWESYRDGVLETVSFDEDGDGRPDRRLTYHGATLTLIESHPDRSGRFAVRTPVGR